MRIVSDYPEWSFILCIVIGFAYTVLLYWKSKKLKELHMALAAVLCILSFFSAAIISLLLFAPFIKRDITHTEKPIIVIAQDNTRSILLPQDSSYYQKDYPQQLNELIKRLRKKYDVQTYDFSETTVNEEFLFSYSGKETNIAEALNGIHEQFLNRNLGAVILATDGIYNRGGNPANYTELYPFPIYSIALGDTTIKKDAKIANVLFNKITYFGNSFPIEFTIRADKLKDKKTQIKVSDNEKTLFFKEIFFNSDRYEYTENLLIEAKKTGVQRYTIEITPVEGEITLENNRQVIFVDVLDKKQKIALIAGAPHPDISAVKQVIGDFQGYEIHSSLLTDFNSPAADYNLLILHQIPSVVNQNVDLIRSALDKHIPLLFILGLQTDFNRFNQLKLGLSVTSNISKHSENLMVINNAFPLFTLDDQVKQKIEQFPPILSRFGTYQSAPNAQTLASAKIRNITTEQPIITFVQLEQNRIGFICGEGLWKWRMADYSQNGSPANFNLLLSKIIQYLSVQNNKSRFWVNHQKIFKENEIISFEAEFYNESYESVNTPDVSITLYDADKKISEFFFNKTASGYYINIGTLAPGEYQYKAFVTYSGKTFSQSGEIIIEETNLEEINLTADHTLLYTLSQKTGGELVYPQDIEKIVRLLEERDDLKPVSYFQKEYSEILSLPWLFVFILLLLSIHWFIRKYNGFI